VTVRLIEPPATPPPPPDPVPDKPVEAAPVVHDAPRPRPRPPRAPAIAAAPREPPPQDPTAVATPEPPAFGISMESTSAQGRGPALPVGSPGGGPPARGSGSGSGSGTPGTGPRAAIADFEATVLPVPQGSCFGTYTDEARAAGIEGTVVLDLVVGDDGRAKDIQVVAGLPQGLTQAAVSALRRCRFSPGERAGLAVPVKIRGFKIHFVLESSNGP
jgi:protein TonB